MGDKEIAKLKKEWAEKKGITVKLSPTEWNQFVINWLKDLENRVQKLECK